MSDERDKIMRHFAAFSTNNETKQSGQIAPGLPEICATDVRIVIHEFDHKLIRDCSNVSKWKPRKLTEI